MRYVQSIKMEEPFGGTPEGDTTDSLFLKYWSLYHAIETVNVARKIMERELFRLDKLKYSEKTRHMNKFREQLTKDLSAHFKR